MLLVSLSSLAAWVTKVMGNPDVSGLPGSWGTTSITGGGCGRCVGVEELSLPPCHAATLVSMATAARLSGDVSSAAITEGHWVLCADTTCPAHSLLGGGAGAVHQLLCYHVC